MSYFNNEQIRVILQGYNDALHLLTSEGKFVVLAVHDLTNPQKFTIVKDNVYPNNKLEGASLTFENAEEFARVFPEFSAPPPVHVPTNMIQDPNTGDLVPVHKDPYPISNAKQIAGSLLIDMGADVELGAIWVNWASNSDNMSIGVATQKKYNDSAGQKFTNIKHLNNIPHEIDEGYNFSEKDDERVKARYILVLSKDRVSNVTVTRAQVIK